MEISRALMTLAFVHDRFVDTGDIRSGLGPLFAPIARENKGRAFDPAECSESLRNRYDIVIQPTAVESLAPTLQYAGILEEERIGNAVLLRYVSAIDHTPALGEQTIDQGIDSFLVYCRPRLAEVGVTIPEDSLKRGLLDRLVKLEFMHILLNEQPSYIPSTTLSLKKDEVPSSIPDEKDDVLTWLDFLCAAFLLHCKRKDQELFDLLVQICSGALLAEVVLDLQNPQMSGDQLSELTILLDGPLVLDLLRLSDKEHYEHVSTLIEAAKKASAKIAILPHTVGEIRGAIQGPLTLIQRGEPAHGPLGRRLPGSPTLQAYAKSVASDVQGNVQKMNIEIFKPEQIPYAQGLAKYPKAMEEALAGRLPGLNVDARLRDAKSILDVLRLRGDDYIDAPIPRSKYVFVSRNDTLVHRSRASLKRDRILSYHSASPAITDRHLAGLLWVISGGKENNLTRTQLIANCTAAVAPRRDVITKMYGFLSDLDPEKRRHFEVLMTKDRACQVLMEKTLGDAKLVTRDNFADIYAQIEKTAAEQVSAERDAEIDALRKQHKEEIAAQVRELVSTAADARRGQALVEHEHRELQKEFESGLQRAADAEKSEKRVLTGIAENCLKFGLRAGGVVRFVVFGLTIVLIAGVAWTIDYFNAGNPLLAYLVGGGLVAFELFAKPDWLMARPVRWAQNKAFRDQAARLGVPDISEKFEIDWKTKQLKHKER